MNYGQLIKAAWYATWQNRSMWWLGMAVFATSLPTQLLSLARQDWHTLTNLTSSGDYNTQALISSLTDLIAQYRVLLILIAACCIALVVLAYVCHCVAIGGLYHAAVEAKVGRRLSVKEMCQRGSKTVGSVLAISFILTVLASIPVVIVTALLIMVGWTGSGRWIAIFLSYIVTFLFLPLSWLVVSVLNLSLQTAILEQQSIWMSIKTGWNLWRQHLTDTLLIYVLAIGWRLLAGVTITLFGCLIAIPLVIFCYFAYSSQAWLALGLIILVGITLLLTIGLILKGITQSFFAHLWHGLYAGIAQR